MKITNSGNIWTTFIISLIAIANIACNRNPYSFIKIHPDAFKITFPFLIGTPGILINTEWGENKKHHVLFLDNFSPSWIKGSIVQSDRHLLINTEYNFNTSTASGGEIKGKVGLCNSLSFGSVIFEKAPFYIMETDTNDQTYDGVFGSELMSRGIWKIDFKNNLLTFTSSIDSLPESTGCEPIIASVQDNQVMINVQFSNGSIHKMFVDLGFNGDFLLPEKDFLQFTKGKKAVNTMRLNTPAGSELVDRLYAIDTVKISNHWFSAAAYSTASATNKLIGLRFFRRFDFVIIDFKNKRLLVPKMLFPHY